MQIPYTPQQRFTYKGTRYEIKTVTPTALEIGCNSTQSLWVGISEFEKLLGIRGKGGLFAWHVAISTPATSVFSCDVLRQFAKG